VAVRRDHARFSVVVELQQRPGANRSAEQVSVQETIMAAVPWPSNPRSHCRQDGARRGLTSRSRISPKSRTPSRREPRGTPMGTTRAHRKA
jgi:hypothetical protein